MYSAGGPSLTEIHEVSRLAAPQKGADGVRAEGAAAAVRPETWRDAPRWQVAGGPGDGISSGQVRPGGALIGLTCTSGLKRERGFPRRTALSAS